MNILPQKRDIDREKNLERKKEIDSGIALAIKIDKLRATALMEEKSLKAWREITVSSIQKEIDGYIKIRDDLKIQNEEAKVLREKLIEPLDKEWLEVNKLKKELEERESKLIIKEKELKV